MSEEEKTTCSTLAIASKMEEKTEEKVEDVIQREMKKKKKERNKKWKGKDERERDGGQEVEEVAPMAVSSIVIM